MNAVNTTKTHKSGWNVKFLHCSDLGVSDKGRSSRVHYRPTVTCHHRNHRVSYRGACKSVEASMLETPAIIRPFIRCVWHKLHKNTPLLGFVLRLDTPDTEKPWQAGVLTVTVFLLLLTIHRLKMSWLGKTSEEFESGRHCCCQLFYFWSNENIFKLPVNYPGSLSNWFNHRAAQFTPCLTEPGESRSFWPECMIFNLHTDQFQTLAWNALTKWI